MERSYLMKKDPQLLARRVCAGPTAEKETSQKIIQFIMYIGFMAMLVVPPSIIAFSGLASLFTEWRQGMF